MATQTERNVTSDLKGQDFSKLRELSRSRSSVLADRTSSRSWNIGEDPAPQWLIEEALKKEAELYQHVGEAVERQTTNKSDNKYEIIISKLEQDLSDVKEQLDTALRTKSATKEKYERMLQEVKMNSQKENDMLREKIVRICTSVFERFGPSSSHEKRRTDHHSKNRRRFRPCEKKSSKLHKQLRAAVMTSSKLKSELTETKRALKEKSEKYDSMNKSFLRLKQEMETTEINLNNLIGENASLRGKLEETRNWMELKIGKKESCRPGQPHFRETQKSRELMNLRKKAEEDLTTITQLRSKVLRLESANANKAFLLNSYKGQVADLSKQRDQLLARTSELENEISLAKSNNAQLRAKISVLSKEKERLIRGSQADGLKLKYEETAETFKTRINFLEKQNAEYVGAIKEVLKNISESYKAPGSGDGKGAGETEARDTACSILNMTPDELTGFMEEVAPNSINSWLHELHRITSRENFSGSLSRFLLKKLRRLTKTN